MTDSQPDVEMGIERRTLFDGIAPLYDRARLGYPEALFADVVALSAIPAGGRILEIGPGTGHATLPLARLGYRIDAVELGARMAAEWRRRLADYPNATIQVAAFEEAEIDDGVYDLAIAASSFHWIDPVIGYAKVARTLTEHGAMAFWWNEPTHAESADPITDALRAVYDRRAPQMIGVDVDPPAAQAIDRSDIERLAASGWFGPITLRRYPWVWTFTTADYLDFLRTFSRYQALPGSERDGLLAEVGATIDEVAGGSVSRHFLSVLAAAHRLPASTTVTDRP